MDEILKAYADRRRQDAGGPIELHPATRQMLQAEVARIYKQVARASWLQGVILFWPRMAFAGACIVITLTLVLVLLPQRTVQHMAQTTAETEVLFRDNRMADKEKSDAFGLDDAPAPAASTAPVPPPSIALDRLGKQNEADELKAKSEVAEVRKDANTVRLMREESFAKEVSRQSYVNVASHTAAAVAGQAGEAQLGARLQTVQPVLNNFQFEQAGNSIRLYEPDGSVYSGNLLSNDEAKKRSYRYQSSAARGPETPPANVPVVGEQLFFAVGTNLSLNQKVAIEGNIVQLTTNAVSAFVPSNILQQNQQVIRARARVGTNQEIPIEAVPAKP